MLNNFRNLQSLFWSHGSRWLFFRVGYALRRRTGLLRIQMPAYEWDDRPLETWLKNGIPSAPRAYAEWRRQNSPAFFFDSINVPKDISWKPETAVEEAGRILAGEIDYFSHTYYKTGFPSDWHKEPITGRRLESHRHWSELSDDPGLDIKFIWEPNRFGMVYPLVRAYASTRDEKYAEAFWELVESWADANPPNTGPNWMDGQEAALRLMAWTFGFYAFLDSPATTPGRVAQFAVMVAAHAERIYKNIAYAVSTRSNHAISEAFGLWLAGLLFPELKDSDKYLALGRGLLEKEAAAQIFPDGTYSMYSLNYHRFVLHIYLLVLRLAEINRSPLSGIVIERVSASIDFLSGLIDPQTGKMPVYGSNDGALVLPLNDCDFTDFRPLLQLGSYATRKQLLFQPGPWDEDLFWLYGSLALTPYPSPLAGNTSTGHKLSFPHGGIYLLHGPDSKAVIRCTEYRSRPSHADQLHVDLWIRGRNIACDAGTYLYSGQGVWRNGLARTAVHNTVTVDHLDQMKSITRFTWTDWSTGKVLKHDEKSWQGEHDGYRRLADPVTHRRTVLSLDDDRWLIVDSLSASRAHHYALHWLLCDGDFGGQEQATENRILLEPLDGKPSDSRIHIQVGLMEGSGNFSIVRADPNTTRGWRSEYYGHKQPAVSLMLEADLPKAYFWSYFGWEGDTVEQAGNSLHIRSRSWQTTIQLDK
jgi:hypothetical protein